MAAAVFPQFKSSAVATLTTGRTNWLRPGNLIVMDHYDDRSVYHHIIIIIIQNEHVITF